MKYTATMQERYNIPRACIIKLLERKIFEQLGGLEQFYGDKVVFEFNLIESKCKENSSFIDYRLELEVTEAQCKDYRESINAKQYDMYKPNKISFIDRLKFLIKGE